MTCSSSPETAGEPAQTTPLRILLVKLGHLGDTLLLTPTLRLLKTWRPQARVDVMVRSGCEVLLRGNPNVDRLLPIAAPEKQRRDFKRGVREFIAALRAAALARYDYAFDLSDSDRAKFWIALSAAKIRGANDTARAMGWKGRLFNRLSYFDWTWQHQVLRDFRTVADVLKIEAEPGPLEFYARTSAEELKARLDLSQATGGYAVIHPVSRWPFKQWLPERWSAVADDLHSRLKLTVVFSCGPAPREVETVQSILAASRQRHVSTGGRLTLDDLARLLEGARLFLGVDTVAMHLAAAMQTPTVALFGPSSEWSWHPWQCRHDLVLGECPCKAARKFVCDKSRPYPCMEKITVDNVTAAVDKLLAIP